MGLAAVVILISPGLARNIILDAQNWQMLGIAPSQEWLLWIMLVID
jgi:hypothetical protein